MLKQGNIPKNLLRKLRAVTGKRARIVVEHILEKGYITTEELEVQYGYKHPPRAARDVREQGIPLITFKVKATDGRSIAAYKFGDLDAIQADRLGGRKLISKEFKVTLYEQGEGRCRICWTHYEERYLQVDHRVPYEISGESESIEREPNDYMLLCGSCNRAKSWSCENCPNWNEGSPEVCKRCYWAYPDEYTHIALSEIRRADIVWEGDEVATYERLKALALQSQTKIPDYVKKVIEDQLATE